MKNKTLNYKVGRLMIFYTLVGIGVVLFLLYQQRKKRYVVTIHQGGNKTLTYSLWWEATVLLGVVGLGVFLFASYIDPSIIYEEDLTAVRGLVAFLIVAMIIVYAYFKQTKIRYNQTGIQATSLWGKTVMPWNTVTEVKYSYLSGELTLLDEELQQIKISLFLKGFHPFVKEVSELPEPYPWLQQLKTLSGELEQQ
jgi:hypothetical protein